MASSGSIKARYNKAIPDRDEMLYESRRAAALTCPAILPPDDHDSGAELPKAYTSIGNRGLNNMAGLMLSALYPITQPWFQLRIRREVEMGLPPDQIEQARQVLFAYELAATSLLESAGTSAEKGRRRIGFRSRKRQALDQILVTGDTLETLTDDYRIKVFKRESYITRRDAAGDVLYHITKEKVDPLSLDPEQIAATDLDSAELRKTDPHKRMVDLFTLIEWNPESKIHVITQEINNKVVPVMGAGDLSIEEEVSPYFSTPFKLVPGEHYGRGFFESTCLYDLLSHNELSMRLLDLVALAAKKLMAIDHASLTREEDLAKDSGSTIRSRVEGGKVMDIAPVDFGVIGDIQMLTMAIERLGNDIGKSLLLQTSAQPNKDRVTARQIEEITRELDGQLGGLYQPIADEQQRPLVRRLIYQMERDNIIETMPQDKVDIETLTGLAALQRDADRGKMIDLMQVMAAFGPEAMQRIDIGVAIAEYQRLSSFHVPGLVKSDEQIAAEMQQALQAQAAQQGIQSGGRIIENAAAAAAQNQGAQ